MKVTRENVTYEGDVEELLKAGVIDGAFSSADAKQAHLANGLPDDMRDLLQKHSPGGASGEAFRSFLKEVLSWDGVEPRRGPSKHWKDGRAGYAHLHRLGSDKGGFVYVHPRSRALVFRVPESAAKGLKYASLRKVQAGDKYKVRLRLESPNALSEAIELAKQAYEDVIK